MRRLICISFLATGFYRSISYILEYSEKIKGVIMLHRHLNHQRFTLAAIDDVIARGKRRDWIELRLEALKDPSVLEKILCVCRAHVGDPYEQRYHFWKHYAEQILDSA